MIDKLKSLPPKIGHFLFKIRVYIASAVVLILFGYVAWQAQGIAKPPIDKARLEERTSQLESEKVRFDQDTINKVLTRSREGPSTVPSSTGDPNPFD